MIRPTNVLCALVIVALAACTRAPSDDALKAGLQAIIDDNVVPGLVEVASARRTDNIPYGVPGAHASVRYEATLTLTRDHRFGAWDQINVGSLIQMLNAAPEEISGIKPEGNVAGDTITVRGRLIYPITGDALTLDLSPTAPAPMREPGSVLAADLRKAVRNSWDALKAEVAASKAGLALKGWRRDRRVAAIQAPRREGGFVVAADRQDPTYWQFSQAIGNAAHAQNIAFAAFAANGPQDALDVLRSGHVTAAILRSTEAALALAAAQPYHSGEPYRLAALAALYPEPVHIVVSEASPFGSPADLYGRHVGVAGKSPADAADAEAILRAHAVPLSSLAAPLRIVPADEALDQLRAGAFDALVITGVLPIAKLRSFGNDHPTRLLPFDSDAIAFLTSGIASHIAITIPARTYPGQLRPLAAVAAVAMLVSLDTVPAAEVSGLLDMVLAPRDYLALGSAAGAMISRTEARRSLSMPWHAGAADFFDRGVRPAAKE